MTRFPVNPTREAGRIWDSLGESSKSECCLVSVYTTGVGMRHPFLLRFIHFKFTRPQAILLAGLLLALPVFGGDFVMQVTTAAT